jgi:hypothetical protein
MRRGRPQLGPELVDNLDVDAATAERLRLILETLTGTLPSVEAAARLGISESAFHKLRRRGMDGMAAALAGSAPGRPPRPPPEISPEQVAELERQLRELKFQVEGARLREQIALLRPKGLVDTDAGQGKKGRKSQGVDRRRKKAERKQRRTRRG